MNDARNVPVTKDSACNAFTLLLGCYLESGQYQSKLRGPRQAFHLICLLG
jgi:hypothetical protein